MLTLDGQLLQEFVGVWSVDPLDQFSPWEFRADNWSDVELLELIKETSRLQWLQLAFGDDWNILLRHCRSHNSGGCHVC